MSQICIILKQRAFLKFHLMVISLRHLHPEPYVVKVLTLPVAAVPTLRAIKHLWHATNSEKSALADIRSRYTTCLP